MSMIYQGTQCRRHFSLFSALPRYCTVQHRISRPWCWAAGLLGSWLLPTQTSSRRAAKMHRRILHFTQTCPSSETRASILYPPAHPRGKLSIYTYCRNPTDTAHRHRHTLRLVMLPSNIHWINVDSTVLYNMSLLCVPCT